MPPDPIPVDEQIPDDDWWFTPYLWDVKEFQEQMGHAYDGGPRVPDNDLILFRLNFLGEELRELGIALGVKISVSCLPVEDVTALTGLTRSQTLADALDALVDLDYVLLGTVLQLGLGRVYGEAWRRVHRANLLKVAGKKASRGFDKDVIKPSGWTAPDLKDLIGDAP